MIIVMTTINNNLRANIYYSSHSIYCSVSNENITTNKYYVYIYTTIYNNTYYFIKNIKSIKNVFLYILITYIWT